MDKRIIQVKLYEPNVAQLEAARVENVIKPRILILNWGRQVGKSMYLRMSTLQYAINNPNSRQMYVNLNFDSNARVIADILDFFSGREQEMGLFIKQIKQKQQEIYFTNGSVIRFKSYEQGDGMRGANLHRLVIDEAAFQDIDVINTVLMPMLMTTGGMMVLGSTSNHVQWFREMKEKGMSIDITPNVRPDVYTLKYTYLDLKNPIITEFVENVLKKQLTKDQYNQEVLNMDVNSEALFYNVEEAMKKFTKEELATLAKKELFIGIDVATTNDSTVVTVGTCDYEVISIDRFNMKEDGLNPAEFKDRILREYRRYFQNLTLAYFEVNNNNLLYDELELVKDGYKLYPHLTTPTNKPQMITHLMKLFEEGVIKIIEHQQLRSELYSFERKISPVSGRVIYANSKDGAHDDCVMSLAIYAWCVKNEKEGGETKFY